jgi:hypothetical protein
VVRPEGLIVTDAGGPIKQFPIANGSYDLPGLAELLGQIKDREPAEDKITLLLDPGIKYDVLVQLMDTVRVQPASPGHPQRDLFPNIGMGDAPKIAGAANGAAAPAAAAAPAGGKS